MKRLAIIHVAVAFLVIGAAPAALAQSSDVNNNGQFGIFVDYTKLQFVKLNLYGVGGRVDFNLRPSLALEGEIAYDLNRRTTQSVLIGTVANSLTANISLIHGLVGAKLQTTKGRIRFFAVAKGGLLRFGVKTPTPIGGVTNQIGAIADGSNNGVVYPGGGVELNIGRFGFRAEAGDEIFFNNGLNHNLRATAGPLIRF